MPDAIAGAPEVTVVIPTKNRWPLLSTTLGIALGQEGVQIEVAVVDDGSTDETPARLEAIDDPRVRAFRHDRSRGVAGARNRGLAEARGEWVAFLDDDDLWSPRKLRTQLEALAQSGALFCYGFSVVLDEEQSIVMPDYPAPDPEELPVLLLNGNVLPGGCSNVVVKTEVARAVGGFDERLSMLADWDMWLRLSDQGRAVRCPEVLVAYRKHTRNMSLGQMLAREDPELAYFASKLRSQRGASFDAVGYSRWLAGEAPSLLAARIHLRAAIAYRSPGDVARAGAVLVGARTATRAARRGLSALRGNGGQDVRVAIPPPEWLEPYM